MARRNDHSRQQRHDLALQAAASLIDDEGLGALSTRRIAARMGYTAGSLYQLFENRSDLILQLNARTLTELVAVMERMVQGAGTPEQAVIRLADGYIDFAHRHPARWQLLYSHQHDAPLPPWFNERIEAAFGLVETQLKRLGPCRHPDPGLAARALWGGIHGIAQLSLTDNLELGGISSAQSVSHCLVTAFIRGLGNEK